MSCRKYYARLDRWKYFLKFLQVPGGDCEFPDWPGWDMKHKRTGEERATFSTTASYLHNDLHINISSGSN